MEAQTITELVNLPSLQCSGVGQLVKGQFATEIGVPRSI
jgi:hypothetical protein